MKFPYGISDFKTINTEDFFYCDRTDKIPLLENARSQLFIRPRRFGKSLLLSMLENYYDVAKKSEFETIFGHLAIGNNPTKLRNSYFILKLDFSCIDPSGSMDDIKQALHDHINSCIKDFIMYYSEYNLPVIEVDSKNCISSIKSLASSVRISPYSAYLLIDEYDNFANTVMMGVRSSEDRYKTLVYDEGPLRTLFKTVKSLTSGSMFDRVFITGVSPVVMSDITSGYNIAENIYFEPQFNDLCGFRQSELEKAVQQIVSLCDLDKDKADQAIDLMRTYYNGYLFSLDSFEHIYNPTLCIYFLKKFQQSCKYPRKMLDTNLSLDQSKLEYISKIPQGKDLIMNLVQKDHTVSISDLEDRFGIKEILSYKSKDNKFLVSFLYYFGVLTIVGETETLKLNFKVPNLVMQSLYVERIQNMFLPESYDRNDAKLAAEKVCEKGEIGPLCKFVEEKFFKVFKNREYRWANELTLKTAFLTLLYDDILFIMDSETEIERRYVDLTMIIRPDKRHASIYDVLIEFKFVALKNVNMSGEEVKKLSEEELYKISKIKQEMENGEKQVKNYGNKLEKKYGNLRLKKFVVLSLGFEKVYFKFIE